ncbi:bifunctional (p)ppGpp synthetase/guanosine-3',5'-bis(diphosphate) 3'-pyrophosphohydrolase [Nocardioides mangrovicus]|uniref:Bifunctional (P)ppGpp synthetase/guanosine-3',5'-bis(Diphosphate) 3'-pyrophosphohydrolase n=1 Tax=Nocardioides mangrovicus TaxID=2478913 RepID=A0A3L8P4U3_9ACTN|nr:bifunctional (p)ppGpp synthetase/guanosine-3',5'-bis(diphosphate) 3'-pyrophosphohydrolase [Nocardioides mangrovicus]RLV50191.1 bifunctional (p)ppGpp synthetase/guanosine-3',5'-bis(diphosphate) 3'-pyrophosphohydrolase [Nocardioides mangrovicus]
MAQREPLDSAQVETAATPTTTGPTAPSRAATRERATRPQERSVQQAPESTQVTPPVTTSGTTQGGLSVRARLARLGRSQSANPVLEPLFRAVRASHPKADLALIERAYLTAERHHEGQLRRSGDPYITHPLAVTTILADIGMTEPTLVAALLHDTVEDTDYTLDQLRADFGEEVALLVDGVTKLDKVRYGDSAQSETIRKMIVAMSRDIRVLVIKLADRLHNMRTLRYLKQETQERKARETLEIFAPLAHRLGMNTLKWELEDLAFATLHPKIYDEIVRLVAERAPSRDQFLSEVIGRVETDLKEAKVKAKVTGRPKHYYSIYQKMVHGGREFSDIYDLVGIRILVDDAATCYAVMGILHNRWTPIQNRFKDYVALPKFNLYQSLHTTVIGPEGKPVEMQIRSWSMHRTAEYGVAAHWKYKEDSRNGVDTDRQVAEADMPWVRQLVEFQNEFGDAGEFLDSLRYEINAAQVYVFTPRGQVIQLPAGATPVDFAYAIHTEVGHHTIGARVNGRLVPLESTLENSDVVEVFTSKSPQAGPSRDWLGFVKSPRARSKIRHWFTKERREEAIEQGKDQIARLLRKEGVPLKRVLTHDSLTLVAQDMNLADVSALYAAVGENNVGAQSVVRKVIELYGGAAGVEEDLAEATLPPRMTRGRRRSRSAEDSGVIVRNVSDVLVKLARCCTPVPGDDIIGFITKAAGVSVHRADCTNADSLRAQPERLVEVEWAPTASSTFLVQIMVEALDRARLLSDITMALSDQHVNILSASLTTTRDRVAKSRFSFEMGDTKHLGAILKQVRAVEGVFDAYRVTQ